MPIFDYVKHSNLSVGEVDDLRSRIATLEAENAELREQTKGHLLPFPEFIRRAQKQRIDALEAELSRARELMGDAAEEIENASLYHLGHIFPTAFFKRPLTDAGRSALGEDGK